MLGEVSVELTDSHCSLRKFAGAQAAPPFTGISRAVVAFHVHLGTFPCYGRVRVLWACVPVRVQRSGRRAVAVLTLKGE